MIIGTLVNAMMAYLSLYHFDEAQKCASFILDTYSQDAEVYYRQAQIIYFNSLSSYEQLNEALLLLE